jgi:hypothetical protein
VQRSSAAVGRGAIRTQSLLYLPAECCIPATSTEFTSGKWPESVRAENCGCWPDSIRRPCKHWPNFRSMFDPLHRAVSRCNCDGRPTPHELRERKMKRLVLIALAVFAVGGIGITCACKAGIVTHPYVGYANIWSVAVCNLEEPFDGSPLKVTSVRHITAEHVTDVPAQFVADPFMMQKDGVWYLYYEVLNGDTGEGDIGLSTNSDGVNWKYDSIVLDEDFHLSYPQVLEHNGEIYMIPESSAAGNVRLYRATDFPTEWAVERILVDKPLVDATLHQHDGRWWMFATPCDSWGDLHLYSTDDLTSGDWAEHPQSPIVTGSARFARPGGRIVKRGDRLFRLAQDHKLRYGHQLWALEITKLTTDEYAESKAGPSPILTADGDGWNGIGMHHLDLHRTSDGKPFACIDGLQKVLCLGPITLGD